MKIATILVPLKLQRYETLGDYFDTEDCLNFRITDTGNDTYNKLILIHELIEELMTRYRGIKEKDILEFDLEFEDNGQEPGNAINAPYRKEHRFAEMIEKMICHELEIDWYKYNADLNKLFDEKH